MRNEYYIKYIITCKKQRGQSLLHRVDLSRNFTSISDLLNTRKD